MKQKIQPPISLWSIAENYFGSCKHAGSAQTEGHGFLIIKNKYGSQKFAWSMFKVTNICVINKVFIVSLI